MFKNYNFNWSDFDITRIKELFQKENYITDNNKWMPLLHLCNKDIKYPCRY